MSANDSLQMLKPEDEEDNGAVSSSILSTIRPGDPVIAVDLDDVLSQTALEIVEWHNENYGTNMKLSDLYYYYYWKNPMWGTMKETFDKLNKFYATDRMFQAKPVLSACEGARALKNMGYRLVIITARWPNSQEKTSQWIQQNFPEIFDSIIYTGQSKRTKAQECADIGAIVLIDDSVENAIEVCTADHNPTPALLFGEYEWNKRLSVPGDKTDEMSFDRRLEASGGREFWKDEHAIIPENAFLVRDWSEVVQWVQNRKAEGF